MKNLLNQEINEGDLVIDFKYGPQVMLIRSVIEPIDEWRRRYVRYYKFKVVEFWEAKNYVRDVDPVTQEVLTTGQYVSTGIISTGNRTKTGAYGMLKLDDPHDLLRYNYPQEMVNKVLEVKDQLANGVYGKKPRKKKNGE